MTDEQTAQPGPDYDLAIVVRPCVLFGEPTVGRTRMAAEQVAGMWWTGTFDQAEMERDGWPVGSMAEVKLACWFMSRHVGRRWKQRYGAWVEANFEHMWHERWDLVGEPPQEVRE